MYLLRIRKRNLMETKEKHFFFAAKVAQIDQIDVPGDW